MSCKHCPDYAKDYKKEYFLIKGIDKCFEYFFRNLNKATTGVFQNHRLEKIKYWLRRFDKFHPLDTKLNRIDDSDLTYSVVLLEKLADFTDYYVDDEWEFDEEAFCNNVDKDFPGWVDLVQTITLFHSKFNIVEFICPDSSIGNAAMRRVYTFSFQFGLISFGNSSSFQSSSNLVECQHFLYYTNIMIILLN